VLQTYSPDHPAIVHDVAQDFEGFANSELPYRQALGYPPYAALALFKSEGDDTADARRPLEGLYVQFKACPGIKMLGPLNAPIARVNSRYWQQLILKSQSRAELSRALQTLSLPRSGSVQMDRDPMNFGV
jgi:primosomal protein N' (replication factor Y)